MPDGLKFLRIKMDMAHCWKGENFCFVLEDLFLGLQLHWKKIHQHHIFLIPVTPFSFFSVLILDTAVLMTVCS